MWKRFWWVSAGGLTWNLKLAWFQTNALIITLWNYLMILYLWKKQVCVVLTFNIVINITVDVFCIYMLCIHTLLFLLYFLPFFFFFSGAWNWTWALHLLVMYSITETHPAPAIYPISVYVYCMSVCCGLGFSSAQSKEMYRIMD